VNSMVLAINCIVFLFAAIVWSREDLQDACVKSVLWMLFICNAIAAMNATGYIVRLHP
jgi:hypothetical protein